MFGAGSGKVDVVKALIKAGATVERKLMDDSGTPKIDEIMKEYKNMNIY